MMALWWTLSIVFLFICLVMTLLVLIQKGRGGGLSGAFGGGGGNTAFGTKTGDVLTWATSIIFGLFVILAVLLNLVANKIGNAPAPAMVAPAGIPAQTADMPLPMDNPLPSQAPSPGGTPVPTH